MTWGGRLVSWLPLAYLCIDGFALLRLLQNPDALHLGAFAAAVYLLPLLGFRLHQLWLPLKPGRFRLDKPVYNRWWASYQFQAIFTAIPVLERILRLVPGLYSMWLRAWGSRIGRAVNWTPAVEVGDRSLLIVGDRVVFGHKVKAYAHVIRPAREGLVLYVAPVHIGEGAFIGIGAVLGPGTRIAEGSVLPAATILGVNQRFSK